MTDILLPKNALTVIRGTSKTFRVTVTDPETGKPFNLTGATLILTVKRRIEDAQPILRKTTEVMADAVITGPTAGVVEFYLVPADTKNKDIREYVFDVWLIVPGAVDKHYAVIPPSIFDLQQGVTVI